ncbi:AAA family ATPase [Rhodoblastus acidophilus]|uniref:Chromosome partition protein Smc n=1 Tax=Candidatus Rhodoblastus alkanivorans TaxID=2954117 RepID=A0ABS9Z4X2_9HYPH|nr:AAA family ATPase [Candidatus Rhodoblastus alkanivorans]MCI4679246.1 AAA family ATPase [Candidatus Rhodoblastus alkanivorans]MCI4682430.1 AAA family ATPase [Candidatus Rhodoblastus alkanivorans]MDI4639736.1 AAA family ATPase [Rhodoblastus acidophilus]
MKFDKLRLTGFKSFVEPTDFVIQPGLTGVVGPNGCGKSNLVEAMRWVMGENSYKQMRASGMDDVIFSGAGSRPSRNHAEVVLVLDNRARSAPAMFNDSDILEITRRIEREQGSTYRVNGREARARDVQLLFADASSGARSPAMVRQGQIGEIIAAKPQARRRILEEAAGIGGLHSRRHEAELRLKGAEENLVRLEDVLGQIGTQAESLRRQARQAARYRALAAEIRRHEALIALIAFREAAVEAEQAQHAFETNVVDVAERTRQQAEAARLQALAAHRMPFLRDAEAEAAAALQRLIRAREALDGEEKRAAERKAEMERRISQAAADLARERAHYEDAAATLARLDAEEDELAGAGETEADLVEDARLRCEAAEEALRASEEALEIAQNAFANAEAQRNALAEAARREEQALMRFEAEFSRAEEEIAALRASAESDLELSQALAEAERLMDAAAQAEEEALEAESALALARDEEIFLRGPLNEAEKQAQKLEAEVGALAKLLKTGASAGWPAVLERIAVARGYEAALGAALGDDLDASDDDGAPTHWALTQSSGDPTLPAGCKPLTEWVDAPPALYRRLAQIGLVSRETGPSLRQHLKIGQRLVSIEGDLWRWDGFTQAAEAPTPAARRLAEKNRLEELRIEAAQAREAVEEAQARMEAARTAVTEAAEADQRARQATRMTQKALAEARESANAAERRQAQFLSRLANLEDARERARELRDEARERLIEAREALDNVAEPATLLGERDSARAANALDRAEAAEARAALQAFSREAETRLRRREAIAREKKSWLDRRARSQFQTEEIEFRLTEAQEELATLEDAPDEFLLQRRSLAQKIEEAEAARNEAADARAEGENALAETDRAARAALDAMSAAREIRARLEAQAEAAKTRLQVLVRDIADQMNCAPQGLAALAGLGEDAEPPPMDGVGARLANLKQDRERLGGVNLRAEDELAAIEAEQGKLIAERDDLAEAIRKLRAAIGALNKEGRERLLDAFAKVDAHFRELFSVLFGGGSAELQLVESDDPLEAGLEILAKPPGKKPATMTLLSGGEQALTAMSLIFAVFLTNPAPICVLDEVDAPLDDANVERFCDLLDDMRQKTDTRFVTITHNPITMARMDRLFGVTQAERGVSQLVSVELEQAEQLLEAS